MSEQNDSENPQSTWEREALTRLASDALREQRRGRRWSIFFRLAFFAYLLVITLLMLPDDFSSSGDEEQLHTAVVKLEGMISSQSEANARKVIKGLKEAFKDENTKAVVLLINSPGGSPVQSGQMHDEILRLRKKYPDTPLYSVIDDICASGGYYVAVAGEKIYADKASIVGSIGVLINGFGFVDAMDKLGVERRLLTAGRYKASLDPFSPVDGEGQVHVQSLLDEIHQQFIDVVKTARGDRLADDPTLFSGLIWSGEQGVKLGLVDELSNLGSVARDVVGAKKIVDFTVGENYLDRFSRRLGAFAGESIAAKLGLPNAPALE